LKISREAVHAAVLPNRDVEWIATFDEGFDALPDVRRFDLG
jgi:predicted nucleic acid-binding protein